MSANAGAPLETDGLAFGRHFVAIPGPSVMPDRVLAAMAKPMPNIYEGALVEASETPACLRLARRPERWVTAAMSS
ncbi:MAG: hypothetical protein AAFU72_14235, partial [Pseudomonadota bacterium]